ncbi:hypothetical protein BVRB_6g134010 [Beta vulgaris subsp. vulgaris]|nr:hypothetical protein BVRB_6g134010 [Beta vulgaris subsp. vulgaris]
MISSSELLRAHHSKEQTVLASSHMDHLFVVLPKQKSQTPGASPRPRGGGVRQETSPSVVRFLVDSAKMKSFIASTLGDTIKNETNTATYSKTTYYHGNPNALPSL